MTDLASRYGAPNRARRRFLVGLVAVAAVAGLTWLVWAIVQQGTPEVRSELVSYDIVDEHEATAVLSVNRSSSDVRATCFLRALAEDHSIVGELTEVVDGAPAEQQVTVSIRTERRATSVERLGCTAPGQNRRR
jgi:hypothetical protein